jgi:MOSC domain-containing protein YiiM
MNSGAMRLLSVQVGLPRTRGEAGNRDPERGEWTSAIFKDPVVGPVWAGREGLAGDGQADREAHGGPERAALMYGAAHYSRWREELGIEFPYGAFGENLTIEGLDEHTACIGDTLAIGGARVQISQPRGPCWKIARRWNRPDLLERVVATGRAGWYCRVLAEGEVRAGDECTWIERPCPDATVARVAALRTDPGASLADLERYAACRWLSSGWRDRLAALAVRQRARRTP